MNDRTNSIRLIYSKGRLRVEEWICEHFHRTTGPFQDEEGLYDRCLDCGRRIPWHDETLTAPKSRGNKAA